MHWIRASAGSKRAWVMVLVLQALVCSATAGAVETSLRVGIYQNRPLSLVDPDGIPRGFFVDILDHIAKQQGWHLAYQACTWDDCLTELQSGRLDLLGAIAFSPERGRLFDFTSESVITAWGQIYIQPDSGVESILDLNGKKVAVLQNDIHYRNLRHLAAQFGVSCRYIEAFDYQDVLGLVDAGKCSAGLVSSFFGLHYEQQYNIKISPVVFSPQKLYFASPKGRHRVLLDMLNRQIQTLKSDKQSFYYEAFATWFGGSTHSPVEGRMFWTLAAILGLVLLFLGWVLLLRAQVRAKTKELQAKNIALREEIEQREDAEHGLRESERKYRSLIENIQDGVFVVRDAKMQYVNDALARMTGYAATELIGMRFEQLVAPEDRATVVERYRRRQAGEPIPSEYECRLLHQDGNTRLFVNIHVGLSADRGKTASIGTVKNITARKRAEQALRNSEERYRRMFQAAVLGIFQITADGEILNVNPAFARLFGYHSPQDMLASGIRAAELHADPTQREALVARIIASRKPAHFQRAYRTRHGAVFYANLNVWPVHDEADNLLYLEGFIEDITEQRAAEEQRRKLEEQLRQAHKMEAVGTLAGGIAHDFNNLLQAIQGYTELLMISDGTRERDRHHLQQIRKATGRGRELTEQLLTFSRKTESKLAPTDLNRQVIYVRTLLKRIIPKMIRIDLQLADTLHPINADSAQIEQVLMNLGINAKDAMPEGGVLSIRTENVSLDPAAGSPIPQIPAGDYVRLTVSDTGQGIDPALQPHIFDPFFTTKEVGKGTGLGLAMVHGIVENHGGQVVCSSEPGFGTSFEIYFPAIQQAVLTPLSRERKVSAGGKETILLIDDEDTVREFGEEVLQQFGYSVLAAENGEDGLAQYRADPAAIDLVILDLIMPGMGGKRCLEKILELDRQAKVIIASGFNANDSFASLEQMGARNILFKPYDMKTLLRIVRDVLDEDAAKTSSSSQSVQADTADQDEA